MKQAKLIALPFINISPYKRWNPIFKGWIAGRTLIFKHTLEKLQTRLKTTKLYLTVMKKPEEPIAWFGFRKQRFIG